MFTKGVVHMLIATVFFTLMNVLVKFLPHIPSYEIVFFRCVISLVITVGLLKRYHIPLFGNNKTYLILRGVFGIIALSMFFTTLQHIPLASAVTIQYLSPIFTTIFAVFFLKERVKFWQWVFFGVSFAGVVLIKGFDDRVSLKFFLIGIAAAIFSGLAYNCIRKLKNSDHPLVVVLYFPLIGMPVTGIISAFNWVMPRPIDWLILLGIGVFTQIAQVQMTKSLQAEAIARVSSVRYLGIVYALIMGFVFFGESYGMIAIIGILLVISGVMLNITFKSKSA